MFYIVVIPIIYHIAHKPHVWCTSLVFGAQASCLVHKLRVWCTSLVFGAQASCLVHKSHVWCARLCLPTSRVGDHVEARCCTWEQGNEAIIPVKNTPPPPHPPTPPYLRITKGKSTVLAQCQPRILLLSPAIPQLTCLVMLCWAGSRQTIQLCHRGKTSLQI